jgi:ElaB/YqjD/DUF883 family membrane-anchored ribosome-binding protein
MVTSVQSGRKDAGANPPSDSPDDQSLAELRKSIAAIAHDLAKVAEVRSRAAKKQAQAGAEALSDNIRHQPALAMAVATAAGALLAIVAVPSSRRRAPASRWVTRADLYDFADSIHRSAARAANSVPLASSLERVVDAVSKVEPNASLTSAIEKAGTWIQKLRSAAKV